MGGWWRLDEVIEPSLQQVCSRAQEVVPVAPTPIEVEAYDSDHEVFGSSPGGDERGEDGNIFKSDDIEAHAAAKLAQVWKANPGRSHHFTSGLGGVE